MKVVENRIHIVGQIQCKDHKEEDSLKDALSLTPDKAPLLTYIDALHLHEVYEVGDKLLYKCSKSLEYKEVYPGSQLFMRYSVTDAYTYAWIEDDLQPYKPHKV
jgi:hypothetical protein